MSVARRPRLDDEGVGSGFRSVVAQSTIGEISRLGGFQIYYPGYVEDAVCPSCLAGYRVFFASEQGGSRAPPGTQPSWAIEPPAQSRFVCAFWPKRYYPAVPFKHPVQSPRVFLT
jgi:hypothetical protein